MKLIPNCSRNNISSVSYSIHWYFLPLLFLTQVLIGQNLFNQVNESPSFTNPKIFSEEEGLTLEYIYSVVEDSTGFVWISGRGGLLRFDGTSFTPFNFGNKEFQGIDFKRLTYEKKTHRLFVNTLGEGVFIIDLNTYEYERILSDSEGLTRFTYWTRQEDNHYLIGTRQGLVRYSYSGDSSFQSFVYNPNDSSIPTNLKNKANDFMCYHKDIINDSIFWIGSVSGLTKFNLHTNKLQRFYNYHDSINEKRLNSIRVIHQESDGNLYLGTWGGGLVKFDPLTQQFKNFTIDEAKSGGKSVVLSIYQLAKNQLGITTQRGYVIFDTETAQFGDFISNKFSGNKLIGIRYIDSKGFVYNWSNNVLNIYPPFNTSWRFYNLPKSDNIAIKSYVKGLLSFDEELLVIAMESKGLYIYDKVKNKWKTIKPKEWSDNVFFYPFNIIELTNGEILIVETTGIFHYNRKNQELTPYKFSHVEGTSGFRKALQHSNGDIWISTQYDGGFKIDRLGEVTHYKSQLQTAVSKTHFTGLGHLLEDSRGNVWISARSGYSVYDYKQDTFYNFSAIQGNTLFDVLSFIEDESEHIWMIGVQHGIAKVNINTPSKDAVHVFNYDVNTNRTAALKDGKGNIWLHSALGLERYDTHNNSTELYSRKYGFDKEAHEGKVLKDGRFFIGYEGKFLLFHPDSIQKIEDAPKPYIRNFEIFNKPYVTAEKAALLKELHLNWRQNFFSIEFSNKNLVLPELDTFAYQLEGIDPDWIYVTDKRFADYTNIASGSYTFKLKSSNDNGVWTEKPLELQINIATPWWKTSWFYILCSVVFLWLVRAVYNFQLKKTVAEQETIRLVELDQFKSRIYTNLTHEFRIPLTVIKGNAVELEDRVRYKQDKAKLVHIQENSDRILNLINQMLELAKLESGKYQVQYTQIDIILFLKYLVDSFQNFAYREDITLSFYSNSEQIWIDIDKEKIQYIISNLISNAIKFTPEYGKIQLFAESKANRLNITIQDTGKGISKVDLPRIFDRFYQVKKDNYNGTGIGLALVKELVDLMEGTIQVESEVNKGTIFKIQFPIKTDATKEKVKSYIQRVKKTLIKDVLTLLPQQEKPLILLIEDNQDITTYLTTILAPLYQILSAKNGVLGIQKTQNHCPKLIISDVMMPEKDGFEVCEVLKNDIATKHIPIILLTAKVTQKDKLQGLRAKADAYLAKPFDKTELLLIIQNLLNRSNNLQSPFDTVSSSFINQFKLVISENLNNENLNIALLCKQLNISRNKLYETVKQETEKTPIQYARQLRLQHAYYLLKTSDKSIKQIAFACGFPSVSAFSQAFKEEFEVSASEIR